MTDWFTADQHFGHARIIELAQRPFKDVLQMDETIIANWNDRVSDDDNVYVLGDFAMGNLEHTLKYVSRLKGRKHLILGNHDRPFTGYLLSGAIRSHQTWLQKYLAAGFINVSSEHWLGLPDMELHLSHFPYEGDSHHQDRYLEHRPLFDEETVLLHGHVHTSWKFRSEPHPMINVGVDVWDFAPVSLEEIDRFLDLA